MKRLLLILCFILLSLPADAANMIGRLSNVKEPPFIPPKIGSVRLSNGMTVYLMKDAGLPMIQGRMLVKSGTVYEEKKRPLAGAVMAPLLKDGGTAKRSPDDVRSFLDNNAIDVTFSITPELFEGYFASLSKDSDIALDIFFEMLFEPGFDSDDLSIVKKRIADSLKREMEISGPITHRRFREMVYGRESPWGRLPKPSQVRRISREDVFAFYNRFFSPDRMILAVAGDFDGKKLMIKLEELAKRYPARPVKEAVPPPVTAVDFPEDKFISKNFTQSAINIGHLGSTRDNPDRFALMILNDILGGSGSFTNRLTDKVRVKGGLAYEVWSAYTFGPKGAPGLFQVHAKTKNKTVSETVRLIKDEISLVNREGVTDTELKKSKDGILKKLVFEYERPFDIVAAVARFVYFGYPENYIEIYRKGIEGVKLEDVNNAARKYLHPDKLKVVVVGGKA